jgi:hypothetical protein
MPASIMVYVYAMVYKEMQRLQVLITYIYHHVYRDTWHGDLVLATKMVKIDPKRLAIFIKIELSLIFDDQFQYKHADQLNNL